MQNLKVGKINDKHTSSFAKCSKNDEIIMLLHPWHSGFKSWKLDVSFIQHNQNGHVKDLQELFITNYTAKLQCTYKWWYQNKIYMEEQNTATYFILKTMPIRQHPYRITLWWWLSDIKEQKLFKTFTFHLDCLEKLEICILVFLAQQSQQCVLHSSWSLASLELHRILKCLQIFTADSQIWTAPQQKCTAVKCSWTN